MAGGNLSELSGVGPNRFVLRNGTCAEYFVRVVVEVPPKPTQIAPGSPGEVDASAEAGDAGDDASISVDADVDSGVADAATD
jgi:hypothetical protein